MPGLFARLARAAGYAPQVKSAPMLALYGDGRAVWTPRDYAALARRASSATPSSTVPYAWSPKRRPLCRSRSPARTRRIP